MAWIQVDKTGYPAAACKKAILSLAVFVSNVDRWFPTYFGSSVGVGCVFGVIFGIAISIVHSPFAVRVPWVTILFPYFTTTVALSKVAMHPTSHNWPMESKEPDLMLGKMWARHALDGMYGSGTSPVCVEAIELPSGKRTWIGGFACCKFVHGPLTMKKFPLAAVSAMIKLLILRGGEDLDGGIE